MKLKNNLSNPQSKTTIFFMVVFLFLNTNIFAQDVFTRTEISPYKTSNKYPINQDKHVVYFTNKNDNKKLLLFIGGTGSKAINYDAILSFAAEKGYHVIGLSYLNFVSAMDVASLPDSLAFDKYRQEICFGTPLSDTVHVDSLNSIVTRATKLIKYLAEKFPTENWEEFLIDSTKINWEKLVIAGHSQGAGHSCYISKFKRVHKAIMFSGPNDFSTFYNKPANWLSKKGVTKTENLFAYLSANDEVVSFEWQKKNLNMAGIIDASEIEKYEYDNNESNILYTTFKAKNGNHGIPITKLKMNEIVWDYLLK